MSMDADFSEVLALAADLAAAGAKVEARADDALDEVADETQKVAQSLAPVRTGTLRGSISVSSQGDSRIISADADYAVHVEFGTYKDAPQPFMFPAARAAENELAAALEDIGDPFE